MDKRLLDILCCPVSKTPVRPLSKHELDALNDAIAAGKLRRKRPAPKPDDDTEDTVPFDPAGALLDRLVGRPPRHRDPEED